MIYKYNSLRGEKTMETNLAEKEEVKKGTWLGAIANGCAAVKNPTTGGKLARMCLYTGTAVTTACVIGTNPVLAGTIGAAVSGIGIFSSESTGNKAIGGGAACMLLDVAAGGGILSAPVNAAFGGVVTPALAYAEKGIAWMHGKKKELNPTEPVNLQVEDDTVSL